MSDFEISDDVRVAWQRLRQDCPKILYGQCAIIGCMKKDKDDFFIRPFEFIGCHNLIVTDFARDCLAAKLRAEHSVDSCEQCGNAYHEKDRCARHAWQLDDWRGEAERLLGVKP